MTIALELVRFRIAEEDVERSLALRPAAIEAVRAACPGMLRADLFRSDEDGLWYDLVLWESVEQARAAAEAAPSLPEAQRWFATIQEVRSVEHAVQVREEALVGDQ